MHFQYFKGIHFFQPKKIFFLLATFLFVFPKGGFKIEEIPITWGYLLLGLIGIAFLLNPPIRYTPSRIPALLTLLPFQIIVIFSLILNGYVYLGYLVSFLTGLFILPWIFLFILSDPIENFDDEMLHSFFKKGIFFLASYGITLFLIRALTGLLIEIPFITTNFHDFGMLEYKCNDRGFLLKLFSTYNNGNLFGTCMLMFYPLYQIIEQKIWKRSLFRLALILTLSRTVWIGLLFSDLLVQIFIPKCRRSIIFSCLLSVIACTIIISIVAWLQLSPEFLFDAALGGRRIHLDVLENATFFSTKAFYLLAEIVYLGILDHFGIIGLITYLIAMIAPLLLAWAQFFPLAAPHKRAIFLGLITYLFISCSDGGILLIPTMSFYWFLTSLLFKQTRVSQK